MGWHARVEIIELWEPRWQEEAAEQGADSQGLWCPALAPAQQGAARSQAGSSHPSSSCSSSCKTQKNILLRSPAVPTRCRELFEGQH